MEVTEVEVHRRPRDVEDDDGAVRSDSPPIVIGGGQVAHEETTSVNPLAPQTATARQAAGEDPGFKRAWVGQSKKGMSILYRLVMKKQRGQGVRHLRVEINARSK
ncbi:unnamed protein product [Cylicocyclus nassatus]|uniref:Uncharacterized protein n=1 Tax=Cylicocyclus nassatus TaxID=53992 RepID=A0AA36M7F8_CYLNA|nr:unnamed protein product [Cylicocyclus nassatus]